MTTEVIEAEVVETTAMTVAPPPPALFGTTEPTEIVGKATDVANALKQVLRQQGLMTNIQGKEYVQVGGWTLLGTMLGVYPVLEWCRKLDNGWEARVEARTLSGNIVGAAEAECTRDEKMWSSRDDYALRSMAQTRATSKALRMPLGFVVTLAGFESTPAEEMTFAREEREYRPQGVRQAPPKAQVAAARQRVAETIHITERDGVDRPPECPQHGNSMKFVPAGTSKKTGKDYSSFWTCESRDCTKGSQGKAYYVDAGNWFNVHRTDESVVEPYDPDELPNE